jgi:multidrug efflux pump subunit AcrA (membrane-fusion protein)
MLKLNRLVILPLTALVVIAALSVACSSSLSVTTASPTSAPVNRVEAPATPKPQPTAAPAVVARKITGVTATGNLISANQVTLSFQIGGRIKTAAVKEGDKVKAGATLATLDTGTLETQVLQAEALFKAAMLTFDKVQAGPSVDDLVLVKSNVDRAQMALDQAQFVYDRAGGATNPFIGMLPQSLALQQASSGYQAAVAQLNIALTHPTVVELAGAAAQVAQAQLALDSARQTLINARLISTIDGTVIFLNAKVGESAALSVPEATIADLTQMQVQVNVDEITLSNIKIGQSVKITVDALGGKVLTGKVRKTGLLGNAAGGVVSVPVTIDIDPTDALIYPGLSATVEFQTGS